MKKRVRPLTEIEEGHTAVITAVVAIPSLRQRLYELGFCPDANVRMALKAHDRIVCEIEMTRIGMHSSIASTILVLPIDEHRVRQ
ncbi:MAG: ferrous iron transport protein A [Bacteroidetes bacterium]|nr:ferrous iron transport protein A [Bacteroidota bacterium]